MNIELPSDHQLLRKLLKEELTSNQYVFLVFSPVGISTKTYLVAMTILHTFRNVTRPITVVS